MEGKEEPRIGVYICECGLNIAATVDSEQVAKWAEDLPNVVVSKFYKYTCSEPGQVMIKDDIKEFGLNRVVVASCSPRMHEPTFRNAVKEVGMNPACFEMANIREHCSWIHKDKEKGTKKAFELVKMAVAKASLLTPLEPDEADVTHSALVVGGGVSGVQAALDIARRGYPVYLVEKEPTLGGNAAKLGKWFPLQQCAETCLGSCAYCILVPDLRDCINDPNIKVFTSSEVEEVDGYVGNFKVKIRKKPTYVDPKRCVACDLCAEVCPVSVKNEFNLGMDERKAIYIPFMDAVPKTYTIDEENCIHFSEGECVENPKCKEVCFWKAVDFDQEEEVEEVEVGAIVLATGHDILDADERPQFLHQNPRVISTPEFERLSCIVGPTKGSLDIDGKTPEKVVFIQCVGSREKEGNAYCSRVCCMVTAKEAHTVKQKLPDAKVIVYHSDVRTFGKTHEEFFVKVKDEGVEYRRRERDGDIHVEEKGDKVVVKCEGHPDEEADLVVLAVGMIPREDTLEMSRILNVSRSGDGFFLEAHPKLRPIDTFTDGVFLAGSCQAPKDIPDSLAQASGAAARACGIISKEKLLLGENVAFVDQDLCIGCEACLESCQFNAISMVDKDGKVVAYVNEALCKGCGTCIASCKSGAIQQRGYNDEQLLKMISVLAESEPGG